MSRGMKRYRKQWEAFAEVLKSGYRPTSFEDTWAVVSDKVCGLHKVEARALWNNLRVINPISLVEIGRNLGGGLFLMCCACPKLEWVETYDIAEYPLTDAAFEKWFKVNNIRADIELTDSALIVSEGGSYCDFVWIDGGHTGEAVEADIEIWKDCEYIGFHDYADKKRNKHKRYYPDVVKEISEAADRYGWKMFGERGRSDIIFKTDNASTLSTVSGADWGGEDDGDTDWNFR